MRWWNDKESIIQLQPEPDRTQKMDYRIHVSTEAQERHFRELDRQSHTLWDVVRALANPYLPEKALQFLAPRSLNHVIDKLEVDVTDIPNTANGEDFVEIQQKLRAAVQQCLVFTATG